MAKCCPASVTPEALITLADIIVRKNPDLAECSPESIFTSLVQAGSLGFSIDPTRGECYLIPRWNKNTKRMECSPQPGYRGLAKLVRGNGKVEYIIAKIVHQKDFFSIEEEPETIVSHRPHLGGARGPVTHVYSVVKFASGTKIYDWMTFEDVEKIRATSQKPQGSFWVNHWDEMAKKTVIKRHSKALDQTPELAKAIELDNAEYQSVEPAVDPGRKKLENNSGYGHGMYASPEQTTKWEGILRKYCDGRQLKWLDRWAKAGQSYPSGLLTGEGKEINIFPVPRIDKHLIKHFAETRALDPECVDEQGRAPVRFARLRRFSTSAIKSRARS